MNVVNLKKGFIGIQILALGFALMGIMRGIGTMTKKDEVLSSVIAIADCETSGGTCYLSSWVPNYCSGGVYRPAWPCPQGYKCYEGGSCHAPVPTNTLTPTPPGPTATRTPTPRPPTSTPSGPTSTPTPATNVTGYHDAYSGTVSQASCRVTGWAYDPNTPAQDVYVRVKDNGVVVGGQWLASNYRSDITVCTGGTCGFDQGIYTWITPNVLHTITVEARDNQSPNEWRALNTTPKYLTCLSPSPTPLPSPTPTRTPTPTPTTIPTATPIPDYSVHLNVTSNLGVYVGLVMYLNNGTTNQYEIYRCTGQTCDPKADTSPDVIPALPSGVDTLFNDYLSLLDVNSTFRYYVEAMVTLPSGSTIRQGSNIVNVTIPPRRPDTITASPSCNPTKVALTWSAVTGAAGYEVWRCNSQQACLAGTYSRIAVTAGKSYTDNSLTGNVNHGYRVRAYSSVTGLYSIPIDTGYLAVTCL